MFEPNQLDELTKKLFSALPSSLQNVEQSIKQQFKEILQATFASMDLITRKEFDVQCKVLTRTREKLDKLERQMNELATKKTDHKH